jgi:ribokinase
LVYDLITIGNPVYDEITTPYISTPGRVLSGCSTNAALVAKKLETKEVGLIGSVGEDCLNKFTKDINKFGIDALQVIQGEQTGGFRLNYFENGDRTLEVLGVAKKIKFEELSNETLKKLKYSKYIILGPILQEIDLNFIIKLKKISKAKLFLDPQGLIRKIDSNNRIQRVVNKELLINIIKLIDFVKPNEYEAETITGYKDPLLAVEELKSWNNKVAIVTLGEKGSIISFNNETHRIPPFKTFAKDPTGAGDSYAGSFITKQLETPDLIESALFASAAASIMVEYTGPDFIMNLKEVNLRMEELRKNF